MKETENKSNQIFETEDNVDAVEKNLPSIARKSTKNHPRVGDKGYVPMKTKDYHAIISCIVEDLIEATNKNDGYKCRLHINNEPLCTEHELIFKVAFVMGDTMAHDKLVCLKKGANSGNNLCRICDVPFDETDDEFCFPKYTRMQDLVHFMRVGNHSKLKELGYWPLIDNAFFKMKYLDDDRGINGSTPSESLHFILQGYFMYALAQFGKLRNMGGDKGNYVFGESSDFLRWTNTRCKSIGFNLSRQSDNSLPRTHFPTGYIIKNKKKRR